MTRKEIEQTLIELFTNEGDNSNDVQIIIHGTLDSLEEFCKEFKAETLCEINK